MLVVVFIRSEDKRSLDSDVVEVLSCINIDEQPLQEDESSNTLWFLTLLVVFLIIALSASGINRSLTNALREREGQAELEDLGYFERLKGWAWNNLVFVSLIGVFLVAFGVVQGYQALMGVGVYEGYLLSLIHI